VTLSRPTLAALLTAPGAAALAVIAIRGADAWRVISSRFEPLHARGWPPERPQAGDVWLGHLRASERGLIDHVIVTVDRADDQTWLEVHCHGGREVVRWIFEILASDGIVAVPWQTLKNETERRHTEVDAALTQAATLRTAAILLDQTQGAMRREISRILVNWPGQEAGNALAALVSRIDMGVHLAEPWKVAVLGAPNVGKSALVNALAGYTRSIVSEVPGTTRDVLAVRLAIDGWPIELWDTAGMRDGITEVEKEGVRLARGAADLADLCLWVLDSSAAPAWPNLAPANLQLVLNKIDLPPGWFFQREASEARIDPSTTAWPGLATVPLGVPAVSAKTGEGIPELCQAISHWLVPEPPPVGAAVPCTSALGERIQAAHRLFEKGHFDDARRDLLAILDAEPDGGERRDVFGT
jgi:tRNA modification GTPase